MKERVTPMIHVPDVQATVDWYKKIGFTVDATYDNGNGGLSFAIVSFGSTQVMFNQEGRPSNQYRREVDLYTYSNNVDGLFEQLKDQVEVVEGLHDTFYGMREFIIRDLNRFWITFGEETAYGALMNGIYSQNKEMVQAALDRGGINERFMTTALIAASGDNGNPEIAEILRSAGAKLPPNIDDSILQRHAGHYQSEQGMAVEIVAEDGGLCARPDGEGQIKLIAIDETTFRPTIFDTVTVTFNVEGDKTVGFQLRDGAQITELRRAD